MAASVASLLGEDAIRRIRLPIEQAGGLPRQAYISPEFFALERERLFPRIWMGIGFTSDVPDPGDAVPLMAAGVPIVLCRDKSGTLRAFHNVCRHRAARVLEKPAKGLNVFSCPYHAWAFGLDGALRAIPFFDGTPDGKGCSLDWSQNGLVPVRLATWHHWVFINLDGQAPPLEEYLAPLIALTQGYDLSATRLHRRVDWEFDANWKFQNDNWETYHHTWVHEGIFKRMSDDIDFATREPFMQSLQWENVVTLKRRRNPNSRANIVNLTGAPLPPVPRIPGFEDNIGGTSLVFPNVTITLADNHLASVITDPLAPDRTHAILGFFFVGDAATSEAMEAARKPVLDRWLGASRDPRGMDGIRSQDFAIWESQQIARQSPVADDVKFSPVWESNIHHFHNRLLDGLL
jgi:choline monooxygenase